MRCNTLAFFIFLPTLLSVGPTFKASNPTSKSAVVERDGTPVFAARFDRPQEFHGQAVSPSGYYFYIWHDDKPPRRLTIYRLTDQKQIADFVPGTGGRFQWTLGDKLLHVWSAGANCQNIEVCDITGATLAADNSTGILACDGGFYITYPTIDAATDHRVVKHDINGGTTTILFEDGPGAVSDVRVQGSDLVFTDGKQIAHRIAMQ